MIRSQFRIAEIFIATSMGCPSVSWDHSRGTISEIQTISATRL
ncbi:hypothetical protein B932_3577 (plasmid) [Gluconobacter oxydans H24]|nr:hypothetical protein B932_3577 [Gluconobacter oxydans H24]